MLFDFTLASIAAYPSSSAARLRRNSKWKLLKLGRMPALFAVDR